MYYRKHKRKNKSSCIKPKNKSIFGNMTLLEKEVIESKAVSNLTNSKFTEIRLLKKYV